MESRGLFAEVTLPYLLSQFAEFRIPNEIGFKGVPARRQPSNRPREQSRRGQKFLFLHLFPIWNIRSNRLHRLTKATEELVTIAFVRLLIFSGILNCFCSISAKHLPTR